MYVCGPTVYDTPHIGNARPAVVFDVLFRLLRHIYGEGNVRYARNYTDIDDKIIERAAQREISIYDLTEQTIAEYEAVMHEALGCLAPTMTPRATGAIPEMLALIAALVRNGHAYAVQGHVFFDVPSYPEHGALSRHVQANLDAGARVEPNPLKRHQSDFVLWKPSTSEQPGWDSLWGRGRPGWHIECSAMIWAHLGTTIDIHGGGGDLRFPHHDCEISQSQCTHEQPLARYWLHNGMVRMNGAKLAKSAGTVINPRDILNQGVPGDAIRLALLSTHYRQPLDWYEDTVSRAEQTLGRWRNALVPYKGRVEPRSNRHSDSVLAALCDDLNTPLAFTRMHDIANGVNLGGPFAEGIAAGMLYAAQVLGILPDLFQDLRGDEADIQAMVDARNEARKTKNFAEADRIRETLIAAGIMIRDQAQETIWWRA
jgi:cysteinyl-tRNA synthetase